MNSTAIAKNALRTLWSQKQLWLFGVFAAAGAGGSSASSPGTRGLHLENTTHAASSIPSWVLAIAIGAGVLGLAALIMHVVSEAALIEGVRVARDGGRLAIGQGLRVGARYFWRVLGIKAVVLGLGAVSLGLVAAPALLGAFGIIPLAAGLVPTGLLVIALVPWMLTLQFAHAYALRFAVLEDRAAVDALRDARQYLHGRIADSLRLFVVTFVGRLGMGLVAPAIVIPAAAIGGVAYLVGGLVPALVAGGLVVLPLALTLAGAIGTFESSVWTLGFLEARSLRA